MLEDNFYDMPDDLLVKYLLNETSAEETKLVAAWLEAGMENRAYFEQFRKIWDASKEMASNSIIDENIAWHKFKGRIQDTESTKTGPSWSWLKIAASVIVIAGIGLLGYKLISTNQVKQIALATGNQSQTDTLSDGSVITLNKKSSLIYPSKFSGSTRPVTLKGEAFFSITADKKKPFIVQVDSIKVMVVGTSFNIRQEKEYTEVIVETGIVKVTNGDNTIELKAGEKTVISAGGNFEKGQVTDKLYNYYRSKEFVCDDTPLWKLVEVINEAYDSHIIIARDELRHKQLNTTFNNESLDQILNIISQTLEVRIRKTGNEITIE